MAHAHEAMLLKIQTLFYIMLLRNHGVVSKLLIAIINAWLCSIRFRIQIM